MIGAVLEDVILQNRFLNMLVVFIGIRNNGGLMDQLTFAISTVANTRG